MWTLNLNLWAVQADWVTRCLAAWTPPPVTGLTQHSPNTCLHRETHSLILRYTDPYLRFFINTIQQMIDFRLTCPAWCYMYFLLSVDIWKGNLDQNFQNKTLILYTSFKILATLPCEKKIIQNASLELLICLPLHPCSPVAVPLLDWMACVWNKALCCHTGE